MKILIVGLLSLIVLTACVRNPSQFYREIPIQIPAVADVEPAAIPPGLKDFCDDKKLVLVVTVNKKGKPKIRKCPGIRTEDDLPDGVDKPDGPPAALGGTQKWIMPGDPDPCIEWGVGGYSSFYCW
ncbi:MAG: hypothetical protein OES20_18470 [Gammaproteobacteria bacterium]|nr:hypothetical protein [Gammaproteobacteria bacterium]